MKAWAEVEIACHPSLEDLVASILWEEGTTGIQVLPGRGRSPIPKGILIKAYFPENLELGPLLESLGRFTDSFPGRISFSREKKLCLERDWKELLIASHPRLRIGRRFLVRPPWAKPPARPGRHDIVILPGLAFGTGQHESTALCLRLLEHIPLGGRRALDAGCGTGILAIAALKMGCRDALAVDIDPQAVAAAMENVRENKVHARTYFVCGEISSVQEITVDVILANLTATIHHRLKGEYRRLLAAGGILVVSGFLKSQVRQLRNALEEVGFTKILEKRSAEWIAMAFEKERTS